MLHERASKSLSAANRVGVLGFLHDWWYGFDFFVSYRWSDGRAYALRLREILEDRGLVVFLDSSDYAKGDNWREEGRRALQRSRRLLLVGSPEVHQSAAVEHEVEVFARLERRILPIDIGGTLSPDGREDGLFRWIRADLIRFTEPDLHCLKTGPSAAVIDDIVHSYELIREGERRRSRLFAAVALLSLTTVVATVAAVAAELAREAAVVERAAAEEARAKAEDRRVIAEGGRAEAILDTPTEWATGLALAVSTALSVKTAALPSVLHGALLRAVWSATPYRVLDDASLGSANASWTPDGDGVLIVGADNTLRLRRLDGTLAASWPAPLLGLVHAEFVPGTGRLVVLLNDDGQVGIWDMEQGLFTPFAVSGRGAAVSFTSSSGESVYTGGFDGTLQRWSVSGAPEGVLWRGRGPILAGAASPRGESLVVSDDTPNVVVLDSASGRVRARIQSEEGWGPERFRMRSVAFSPSGEQVVTGGDDETLDVWDARTGRLVASRAGHVGAVTAVRFRPDGLAIASGGEDMTVRLSERGRGQMVFLGPRAPVRSVAPSADGSTLVTASEDGAVRLWDARPPTGFTLIDGSIRAPCAAAASDGGGRIVTVDQGDAVVWRTDDGTRVTAVRGGESRFVSAALSGDGLRLATVTAEGTASVWDATSGTLVRAFPPEAAASSVVFAPDHEAILVAGLDGVARALRLDGQRGAFGTSGDRIYSAVYSPDGARVLTCSARGAATVWDAFTGTRLQAIDSHGVLCESGCFAPDGGSFVTAGADGVARRWVVGAAGASVVLRGHHDWVRSAVYSTDGERLFTAGGTDQTIRIWDAATGAPVGEIDTLTDPHAVIVIDDTRLAVPVTENRVWIGPYDVGGLLNTACAVLTATRSAGSASDPQLAAAIEACAGRSPTASTGSGRM